MKNLKMRFPTKDEKGIALLFTLGILAVLLVIALGFATTSITERKAAGNSNDLTVARMLAESAVNRAVGAMRFYADLGYPFDDIISHDVSSTPAQNQQTFDMLYKLNTVVNGSLIWYWPSSTYDRTLNNAIHWQYVDNGLTGDKLKLLGRYAYLVFGTSGKLDPAACINQTVAVDEGATYGGLLGDMQDRNGVSVNEISIYNLDQDANNYLLAPLTFGITPLTEFSYNPLVAAGTLTAERWTDWETMFTALGIATTATAQRNKYRDWFILNNPKDPEAFWIDVNGDGIEEPSELYHRFNLAREATNAAYPGTEPNNPGWSQITVSDIIGTPPSPDPDKYTNVSKYYDKRIKWLRNCTNLPVGTFPDAATRAKQIAANLIDYCDGIGDGTDNLKDEVTRDSDTDPTYTGNEITPYINEIAVRVDASATVASTWLGAGRRFTYNITYYLGAEVVNVYGASLTLAKATTLKILEGTIFFKYTTPDQNDTIFTDGTISLDDKEITLDNPLIIGYTFEWDGGTTNPVSITSWNVNDNAKITSVNVQIKRAVLNYDGIFADFAKPDYAGGTSETTTSPLVTQAGIGTATADKCFFSYQVDDPRQNLNDGDWEQAKQISPLGASYATIGSEGLINSSKVTCTTSGDAESGSTPTTISTGYIRNAPIQSPWELCFIHRGAKWETLNIHTYNTTAGVSDSGGIGTYANGDANILDQIKMSGDTEVYGKVNVQAAQSEVLKALVGYIRVGTTLPNIGTDGLDGLGDINVDLIVDNVDNNSPGSRNSGAGAILNYGTDVATIAAGIVTTRTSTPFKTRAQIARTPELFNRASQINKATKDEIIGKFINLTKAQASDTYTVIAIAQTIKDVGAPSTAATGITISKDLNQDGIIDAANPTMKGDTIAETAVGFRDASGTRIAIAGSIPDFYETLPKLPSATPPACKLGQYDLGADEILAEQKIMATVYRDTLTGKWRILRYEYLDE